MAAEKEAARVKAEQEAAEAARMAAEKEAARLAAEEERATLAAEQAKQEEASKPLADLSVDAQIQDALAKVAEARRPLQKPRLWLWLRLPGAAKPNMGVTESRESAPVPAAGSVPKLKVLKTPSASVETSETPAPAAPDAGALPKLKVLKSSVASPPASSAVAAPASRPVPAASAAPSPGTPLPGGGMQPPAEGENAREMAASVDKSKSLLRGIVYGVCALVLMAGGVGIYAWQTNAKKDQVEGENAQLNKLVMEGAKLGRSRLFDSRNLGRVPDVKVVPNEEDAALLLDNVRGVKGHRDNWPGAGASGFHHGPDG